MGSSTARLETISLLNLQRNEINEKIKLFSASTSAGIFYLDLTGTATFDTGLIEALFTTEASFFDLEHGYKMSIHRDKLGSYFG